MSEPFVGEIRMFAGSFAPRGWAFCDGQDLAISQNDALFSLLGTIYGGDGRSTYGLPDMRGRIPIHAGTGPGLSQRRLGAKSGTEKETVQVSQLPSHLHSWRAFSGDAQNNTPNGTAMAKTTEDIYSDSADDLPAMNAKAVTSIGGSRSHSNLMPYLCIHFIIALFGTYPSRN